MSNKSYLFGYGSIRTDLPGYGQVPRFLNPIGFGVVEFPLYKIENHWGVWAGVSQQADGRHLTRGQIFEITGDEEAAWRNLDWREQAESVRPDPCYIRRLADVKLDSGKTVKAYIYFVVPEKARFIKRVKDGDWKNEI